MEKDTKLTTARQQRVSAIVDYALLVGTPLAILVVWQLLGNLGRLNLTIMPTPFRVVDSFASYIQSGMLSDNFFTSLHRVAFGFLLGGGSGLVLGIMLGLFPKFERASAVVLGVIRPIPMVGLVPLFILWFGIGELSKVLVIAIGALWPVLLNTESGIRNVDAKHLEVARILKKDRITILRRIILPSAVPSLLTGVRLGLSNAWRGIVAAEMVGASKGVGYLISYAREMSQPAVMFMGLTIIGVIGILIDILLLRIQNRMLSWT